MNRSQHESIECIALLPNLDKPDVPMVTKDLVGWLLERNIKVALLEEDAQSLGVPELACDEPEFISAAAVVVLGGDGSILRAVRMLKGAPVPVIGVNMGRVGFLSEVERGEMYPAMERVIAGDFCIDERMMLKCTIVAGDVRQEYLALNEVVIERDCHQRMMQMDVSINGIMFSRYTADGLIMATPTGSTAYSFSAGGPVVSPDHELILLTPVNPHSLFGRTVALGMQDVIRVEMPRPLSAAIGVDGFLVFIAKFSHVQIERAKSKAHLIKLKERDFYTLFKEKLRVWDSWLR